jgi:MFS family permease
MPPSPPSFRPGLRENLGQFTLLVVVNAFVGGMVGLERTILPRFAETVFAVDTHTAILSFIVAFGLAKAVTNYYTGRLANHLGRRNLLILGWLLALPIPFLLMHAPSWNWVIAANLLLGVSQGMTWSSTVVMKIDLVGEKDRGLAMGLNEFAGYLLSVLFVKDTRGFVRHESAGDSTPLLKSVFLETTWRHRTLGTITQAGLVNNLNDGMIWGLLPILLLQRQFDSHDTGLVAAIYPVVWGVGQLATGKMADHLARKPMLVGGMLLQGIAILLMPFGTQLWQLALTAATLGWGTALVYPTFLVTIAQATHASQRAESLGTFRLWRDLGYAVGAVISGITADLFGVEVAIGLIGAITLLSAGVIRFRMPA